MASVMEKLASSLRTMFNLFTEASHFEASSSVNYGCGTAHGGDGTVLPQLAQQQSSSGIQLRHRLHKQDLNIRSRLVDGTFPE